MKEIMLIILLSALAFTTYAQTKTNPIETQTSFNGRHCRGTSVQPCTISIVNQKNEANTRLYINNQGLLVMQINPTKISKKIIQEIIGSHKITKNKYTLKDSFILDDAIHLALKLPTEIREIPKGIYPVTINKKNIIITFKLR